MLYCVNVVMLYSNSVVVHARINDKYCLSRVCSNLSSVLKQTITHGLWRVACCHVVALGEHGEWILIFYRR